MTIFPFENVISQIIDIPIPPRTQGTLVRLSTKTICFMICKNVLVVYFLVTKGALEPRFYSSKFNMGIVNVFSIELLVTLFTPQETVILDDFFFDFNFLSCLSLAFSFEFMSITSTSMQSHSEKNIF